MRVFSTCTRCRLAIRKTQARFSCENTSVSSYRQSWSRHSRRTSSIRSNRSRSSMRSPRLGTCSFEQLDALEPVERIQKALGRKSLPLPPLPVLPPPHDTGRMKPLVVGFVVFSHILQLLNPLSFLSVVFFVVFTLI